MAELFDGVEDVEVTENLSLMEKEMSSLNQDAYSPNMRKNIKNVSYQVRT